MPVRVPVLAVPPRVKRIVGMMVRDVVMIVRESGRCGYAQAVCLGLGVLVPIAGETFAMWAFLNWTGSGRSRAINAP